VTSNILWRYRPYLPEREQELEEIVAEGKIWCPASRNFNDPFDLNPVFRHTDIPISEQVRRVERMIHLHTGNPAARDDVLEKARAGYMNSDQYRAGIEEALRRELGAIPILCFYPDWGSLPMWAHYATTASGFAVGVDFSEPWEEVFYPLPVAYSNERPVLNLSDDIAEDKAARRSYLEHVFLTKSNVWAQEQEQRVIFHGRSEGHYGVDPSVVKEVCFGFKAPEHLIEAALGIARESVHGLTVSQISISDRTYSLERHVLNP